VSHSVDVPDRGLRRNAVGLPALVAQSLGVTAPEISAVVIASVVAAKVGGATPFAFLIAGIGALGLALIYGRFARYVPHAGGTYAIVRAGLGRDAGFFSGWVVLAVGIIFVPALLVAAAFLLQNFFGLVSPKSATILSDNWILWAALLGVVLIALSYFGIQVSAWVLLTLTAIGVTMLVVFDIFVLAKGGADGLAWKSLTPDNVSLGDLALAVGIAMTGFSGFETAVFLAEEAKTPRRQVPKAVVGAVLLAIVFFVFTTFSIVSGYGLANAGKAWPTDSGGAVVALSAQFISLGFGKVLLLLLAISSFASALGTANFTTRVAFSWGHDGYLPRSFGRTQPRYQSPHVAIAALAALIALVFAGGLIWQGKGIEAGLTYFSWLLQAGATGILVVYALVAIAGAIHSRRHGSTSALDLYIAPAVALVVVVAAEVTEFYDQPSPFKYAPYVMLAWMALGVVVRLATRNRMAAVERDGVTPERLEAAAEPEPAAMT
jgi:amino acid transporter